jgi:hypothetical protein
MIDDCWCDRRAHHPLARRPTAKQPRRGLGRRPRSSQVCFSWRLRQATSPSSCAERGRGAERLLTRPQLATARTSVIRGCSERRRRSTARQGGPATAGSGLRRRCLADSPTPLVRSLPIDQGTPNDFAVHESASESGIAVDNHSESKPGYGESDSVRPVATEGPDSVAPTL